MTALVSRHPARVPVEHRVLGMDRRSLPYAAVALAVVALWAWVMPWVNAQVTSDDPIEPGDVLQVAPQVTMQPIAGWELQTGLRTSDRTRSGQTTADDTVLTKDGVTLAVVKGPFKGDLTTLLGQINKITSTESSGQGFSLKGQPRSFKTTSGLPGLAEGFQSARVVGVIAALRAGGTGLQVQMVGPPQQMNQHADDLYRMVESLTYTAQDG